MKGPAPAAEADENKSGIILMHSERLIPPSLTHILTKGGFSWQLTFGNFDELIFGWWWLMQIFTEIQNIKTMTLSKLCDCFSRVTKCCDYIPSDTYFEHVQVGTWTNNTICFLNYKCFIIKLELRFLQKLIHLQILLCCCKLVWPEWANFKSYLHHIFS